MDNMNSDPTVQPNAQPVVQSPELVSPLDQASTPDIQPVPVDLLQSSNDPFSNLSLSMPPDPFLDVGQPQPSDIGQPGQFGVGSFFPTQPIPVAPPVTTPIAPVIKRVKRKRASNSVLRTSRSK